MERVLDMESTSERSRDTMSSSWGCKLVCKETNKFPENR